MREKSRCQVAAVPLAGLRRFFAGLIHPAFAALGCGERALADYVVDMLARFARTDQLYRIREPGGRRLETIAEMLMELNRQWEPETRFSFDRELEIRRHCGDYALFMSGLFRAHVEHLALLDYYLLQGGQAYRSVAEMGQLAFAGEARLFAALGSRFEHLSGALDYVRKVHMRPALHGGVYGQMLRDMERF